MKRTVAIAWIALLAACGRQEVPQGAGDATQPLAAATQPAAPASIQDLPATYSGILPCADCEGIRYDLELRDGGAYALRTTYLGKPEPNVFDHSGAWSLSDSGQLSLQGSGSDPEYFVVIDAQRLRKLDREGKPIGSQLNYDITRQSASSSESSAPTAAAAAAKESDMVTHDLVGTRWALVKLGEQPVAFKAGGKEPFLALQTDARAVGLAGCNRFMGPYKLDGGQLSFRQLASTQMACPDLQMEDAFLKALSSTARFRISGDQLELLDASGSPVATFAARNL